MKIKRLKLPAPHIPFISLADIAWQIIIFFLLAATFIANYSLNVPMPSASPGNEVALGKTINVRASEVTLTVNGVPVMSGELESYISSLLAGVLTDEGRAVIVFPEDDLSFQRNSEILYAIQKAGGIPVISEERRDEDHAPAP